MILNKEACGREIKEKVISVTTNAAGNTDIRTEMDARAYLTTAIVSMIIESPITGLIATPCLYVSGGYRYLGVHVTDLNGSPYAGNVTLRVFFMDI